MKIDEKLIEALLDLLDEGANINKHSLSKRAKVFRMQLDRRIAKHKSFIDVEVVK
jgi:hypothetical protein